MVVVRDSVAGTDEVVVKVGLKTAYLHKSREAIVKELKDSFRSRIRVAPMVEILPAEEIRRINFPAKSRKPVKFIDERKR